MTQPSPVTGKEDIVERLRLDGPFYTLKNRALRNEAADEIERLRRSSGGERGAVIKALEIGRYYAECEMDRAENDCAYEEADEMKKDLDKFDAAIRSLREAGGDGP